MNSPNMSFTTILWLLTGYAFVSCSAVSVRGADLQKEQVKTAARRDITQIMVPKGEAELWPRGDWHPVESDSYRKFLIWRERKQPGPKPVVATQAVYSASLAGTTLQQGTFSVQIINHRERRDILPLEQFNLAVSRLKWDNKTVDPVWGTSASGQSQLLVPVGQHTLQGAWSLDGEEKLRSIEYEVNLLPAIVSRLKISLPSGFLLQSSAGEVVGPLASNAGKLLWQVELGSETHCRLKIQQHDTVTLPKPLILIRNETAFAVRQDELQFQTEVSLDVYQQPLEQFHVLVPDQFKIYAVSYGKELPLKWKVSKRRGGQLLEITLPDPISGKSRPIRIDGSVPVAENKKQVLKSFIYPRGHFLGGNLHLRFESPVQLQSFSASGFLQKGVLFNDANEETLTFQQFQAEASISYQTGPPPLQLEVEVRSHLSVSPEQTEFKSWVDILINEGHTYRFESLFAREWQILNVDTLTAKNNSTAKVSDWHVTHDSQGRNRLHVEFQNRLVEGGLCRLEITARRRTSSRRSRMTLPVLQPQQVNQLNEILVVHHPDYFVPRFTNQTKIQTLTSLPEKISIPPLSTGSEKSFKEVTDNEQLSPEILDRPEANKQSKNSLNKQLILQSNSPASTGILTFESTGSPITATADILVTATEQSVQEICTLEITPLLNPVNQVVVYINSSHKIDDWRVVGANEIPFQATQLSESEHTKWKLPQTGQLWRIQLSRPVQISFKIFCLHKEHNSSSYSPALFFIPDSTPFAGTLEFKSRYPGQFKVQSSNLETVQRTLPRSTVDNLLTSPFKKIVKNKPIKLPLNKNLQRVGVWEYHKLDDFLIVQKRDDAAVNTTGLPVWGSLETFFSSTDNGKDRHIFQFFLPASATQQSLKLKMPHSAILDRIELNGQTLEFQQTDDQSIILNDLLIDQLNIISVYYTLPTQTNALFSKHLIELPQINRPVVYFKAQVALPPTRYMNPSQGPFNQIGGASQSAISWMTRYLGPVGRKAESAFFNPIEWESWRIQKTDNAKQTNKQTIAERKGVPAGWSVFEADSLSATHQLEFILWDHRKIQGMAWLCFVSSIIAGIVLRRFEIRWRASLGTLWVLCNLISAWYCSSAVAQIFGANVAGTMIAVILPMRAFGISKSVPESEPSTGSTASYVHLHATVLLIATYIGLSVNGVAQENIPAGDESENIFKSSQPVVMVPVETDAALKKEPLVVYLNETLNSEYMDFQRIQSQSDNYVISEARYQGEIKNRKEVALTAEYLVQVYSAQKNVVIELPIRNAHLGGEKACLVNGSPHPVLQSKDQSRYLIQLSLNQNENAERNQDAIKTFQIVLQFHPLVQDYEKGTGFLINIPPIVNSRLNVLFDKSYPSINVLHCQGAISLTEDRKQLDADLGRTDKLKIIWSDAVQNSIGSPCEVNITPVSHYEVHPGWMRVKSLLKYEMLRGKVSSVHLQLPPEAMLKDIPTAENQTSYSYYNEFGNLQLAVEFKEAQSKNFVIKMEYDLPLRLQNQQVVIPPIDYVLENSFTEESQVIVKPHLVAVNTIKEFDISEGEINPAQIERIDRETYLSQLTNFLEFRSSNLIFSMAQPASLPMTLEPQQSVRTIRMNQIVTVHTDQLNWTCAAEVNIQNASVFTHELLIDSQLEIQSVSVKEDEAERLVRWIRTPTGISLVLNDRSLGTQDLLITGKLSIPSSGKFQLPTVKFRDATIDESQVAIYRSPNVSLQLINNQNAFVPNVASGSSNESDQTNSILYGEFDELQLKGLLKLKMTSESSQSNQQEIIRVIKISNSEYLPTRIDGWVLIPHAGNDQTVDEIRLSPEWGLNCQIDAGDAEVHLQQEDQGSQLIQVMPGDSNSDVLIHVSKEFKEIDFTANWNIPRLELVDFSLIKKETLPIFIIPKTVQLLADEPQTKTLLKSEVDEWVTDIAGLKTDINSWKIFKSSSKSIKIHQHDLSRQSEVTSFQTKIWLNQNKAIRGHTEIVCIPGQTRLLKLSCPDEFKLKSITINGRIESSLKITDHALNIPFPQTDEPCSIYLIWSLPLKQELPQFGRFPVVFPAPVDVVVLNHIVSLIPKSELGISVAESPDLKQIPQSFAELYQLEGLMRALQESSIALPKSQEAVERFLVTYDQFQLRWNKNQELLSTDLNSRISEINRYVEQLQEQQKIEKTTTSMNLMNSMSSNESHTPLIYHVSTTSQNRNSIQMERYNHRLGLVVIFMITLLTFYPLLRWLFHLELGAWFNNHPYTAWAILGLFWWICFSAGWAGLLIMLIVLCLYVQNRFEISRRSSSESIELSA